MTIHAMIDDLRTRRKNVEGLRTRMEGVIDRADANQRQFLDTQIALLSKCLESTEIPDFYRIAVVGQFKTGKSSFVNRLAGERLAGVETNPETAAICIFRYADTPRAEVRLIDAEEWARMLAVHATTPDHPEAYRVQGLLSFNNEMAKRRDADGKAVAFTPIATDALVREWVTSPGRTHKVQCPNWSTAEGKKTFRSALRRFTSAREPLHYFVKEIVVYVPVPLLKDNIELIDTPGLNDTQLYRGQLTEGILRDVDVILLLTRSGASFSQFDKDFLVRQLRKRRLHHLRVIVTHVDNTFENAVRDANDDDTAPPTYAAVKSKEEARIRSEITKTLDELLRDANLSEEDGYYLMEKLDALPIHFTSVRWFDDSKHDDSGIPKVQQDLLTALLFQERIKALVAILDRDYKAVRERILSFFQARRQFIAQNYDSAMVAERIAAVSARLAGLIEPYKQEASRLNEALDDSLAAQDELVESFRAQMVLSAKNVLASYENTDAARHWRTRRAGYWGYFTDLGGHVADRIFPIMAKGLKRYQKCFETFADGLATLTRTLATDIQAIEKDSAVEDLPALDLEKAVHAFANEYLPEISSDIEREQEVIIEKLEEFVSDDLKEHLDSAKSKVSEIWGRGTTVGQSSAVREFYSTIAELLDDAVNGFAKSRTSSFRTSLRKRAQGAFPYLQAAVTGEVDNRSAMLRQRIAIRTEAEKTSALAEIDSILKDVERL